MKIGILPPPELLGGVHAKKCMVKCITATTVRCHEDAFLLLQRALDNPVRCEDEMDAADDAFKKVTKPGPKGATVPEGSKKRKQNADGGAEKRQKGEKPAKKDTNAYAQWWYHQNRARPKKQRQERKAEVRSKSKKKPKVVVKKQRPAKRGTRELPSSSHERKRYATIAKEFYEEIPEDDKAILEEVESMSDEEFIGMLDFFGPLHRYEKCELLSKMLMRREMPMTEAEEEPRWAEEYGGDDSGYNEPEAITIVASDATSGSDSDDTKDGDTTEKDDSESWGSPVEQRSDDHAPISRLFLAAMNRPPSRGEVNRALGRQRSFVTKLLNTREALNTDEGQNAARSEVRKMKEMTVWNPPVERSSIENDAVVVHTKLLVSIKHMEEQRTKWIWKARFVALGNLLYDKWMRPRPYLRAGEYWVPVAYRRLAESIDLVTAYLQIFLGGNVPHYIVLESIVLNILLEEDVKEFRGLSEPFCRLERALYGLGRARFFNPVRQLVIVERLDSNIR